MCRHSALGHTWRAWQSQLVDIYKIVMAFEFRTKESISCGRLMPKLIGISEGKWGEDRKIRAECPILRHLSWYLTICRARDMRYANSYAKEQRMCGDWRKKSQCNKGHKRKRQKEWEINPTSIPRTQLRVSLLIGEARQQPTNAPQKKKKKTRSPESNGRSGWFIISPALRQGDKTEPDETGNRHLDGHPFLIHPWISTLMALPTQAPKHTPIIVDRLYQCGPFRVTSPDSHLSGFPRFRRFHWDGTPSGLGKS